MTDLALAIEKMQGWRAKYRRPGAMVYAPSGLTAADVDTVLEAATARLPKSVKKALDI